MLFNTFSSHAMKDFKFEHFHDHSPYWKREVSSVAFFSFLLIMMVITDIFLFHKRAESEMNFLVNNTEALSILHRINSATAKLDRELAKKPIRCSGHDSTLCEVENQCDWFPFHLSMWIQIMEIIFANFPVRLRNDNVLRQKHTFSSLIHRKTE